jgi:hypothetical protein
MTRGINWLAIGMVLLASNLFTARNASAQLPLLLEALEGRALVAAGERALVGEGLEAAAARAAAARRPLYYRPQVRVYNETKFAPEFSVSLPDAYGSAPSVQSQGYIPPEARSQYDGAVSQQPSASDYEIASHAYQTLGDRVQTSNRDELLNSIYKQDNLPQNWQVIAPQQGMASSDYKIATHAYRTLGDRVQTSDRDELLNSIYKQDNLPQNWQVIAPQQGMASSDYQLLSQMYQSLGDKPVRTECYANGNAPNCDNVPIGWRVER